MINFKNIVLGIGIIIVFGLALWQGIEAFYATPQYEDFCGDVRTAEVIDNQARCEEIGGRWNAYETNEPRAVKPSGEIVNGYCDRDYTCRQEYDDARDRHSQVVFIISLIVGIIALIVGYSILSLEPVGSALMGSGIWAIFWGSAINWRNFSDIWRFLLLLLALILLIWFAWHLNKPGRKGFWERIGFWKK